MLKWLTDLFAAPPRDAKPVASPPLGPPAPWRQDPDERGAHGFVAVVGESNYQETLEQLSSLFEGIGRTDRHFDVQLIPEPNNPYDANAVAIKTDGGATIGYLARDVARSYHRVLAQQPAIVRCPAQLRGDGPIGVVLDFLDVNKLKGRGAPSS